MNLDTGKHRRGTSDDERHGEDREGDGPEQDADWLERVRSPGPGERGEPPKRAVQTRRPYNPFRGGRLRRW